MFDSYDRKILNALQADGRVTNQQLAELIGLSSAATWRRVKALEEAGVIRQYTAILDATKVARGLRAILTVSLQRHDADSKKRFEERVSSYPEVLQFFAITGGSDFVIHVVVEDIQSYDRFINEKIFTLEGVGQVHSHFALRELKNETALPIS